MKNRRKSLPNTLSSFTRNQKTGSACKAQNFKNSYFDKMNIIGQPRYKSRCLSNKKNIHNRNYSYQHSSYNSSINKINNQNLRDYNNLTLIRDEYNSKTKNWNVNGSRNKNKHTNKKISKKRESIDYALGTGNNPSTNLFNQYNITNNRNKQANLKSKKKRGRKSHPYDSQLQPNSLPANTQFQPNHDLLGLSLKHQLKPNKLNFMNKVSNVYDLLLGRVMLPQFVEYFLGQGLYVVRGGRSINKNAMDEATAEPIYQWKLDQFKNICQKIYETSQQQDLKHFMNLSLPTITRYSLGSRPISTKNSTLPTSTQPTDSRVTEQTIASLGNKERISYFKSLSKKERPSLGYQKDNYDIVQKLNMKLDQYLSSHYRGTHVVFDNTLNGQLPFQSCKNSHPV